MSNYGSYPKKRELDVKKRLMANVHLEDNGYVDEAGEASKCLIWDGEVDRNGYGRIKDNKKYVWVHWVLKGKPPEGLEGGHLCEVRRCCRPSHIEWQTREDNLKQRDESQRRKRSGEV